MLLIGSPLCTLCSSSMAWNKGMRMEDEEWQANYQMRMEKAKRHIEFCCSLYKFQMSQGRHFLHEHPWNASSWKLPCIEEMMDTVGVYKIRADLCQFNLRARSYDKEQDGKLLKKPKTSSSHLVEELGQTCTGQNQHGQCKGGGVPAAAAEYTKELCIAMCKGLNIRQHKRS